MKKRRREKSDEEKTDNLPRTTIRIKKLDIVKQHFISDGFRSLKEYINYLIEEDIKNSRSEYIIQKYFKDTKI